MLLKTTTIRVSFARNISGVKSSYRTHSRLLNNEIGNGKYLASDFIY